VIRRFIAGSGKPHHPGSGMVLSEVMITQEKGGWYQSSLKFSFIFERFRVWAGNIVN
jgi:hypothetical protein